MHLAPDEIVIDKKSADKGDFALGETVRVISQVGSRSTASPASRRTVHDAAGAVVAFTAATGARSSARLVATPAFRSSLRPAWRMTNSANSMRSALNAADVEVITGEQAADEAAEATGTR